MYVEYHDDQVARTSAASVLPFGSVSASSASSSRSAAAFAARSTSNPDVSGKAHTASAYVQSLRGRFARRLDGAGGEGRRRRKSRLVSASASAVWSAALPLPLSGLLPAPGRSAKNAATSLSSLRVLRADERGVTRGFVGVVSTSSSSSSAATSRARFDGVAATLALADDLSGLPVAGECLCGLTSPDKSTPEAYLNFFFGVANGERAGKADGAGAACVAGLRREGDGADSSAAARRRRDVARADLKRAGETLEARWTAVSRRSCDWTLGAC